MLIFFVYGIPAPCLSASFVLCCKWSNVGERSSGCFVSPARRRVLRAHRQDLRERYLCTLRTPRTTTRLCLGFLGAGSSCRRNKNTSSFCSLSYEKARPRKDRLCGFRRGRRLCSAVSDCSLPHAAYKPPTVNAGIRQAVEEVGTTTRARSGMMMSETTN